MPEQTREKIEFATNIPTEVTLGKNFKSGEGQWGAWHGWNVFQGGTEKVIFAKDALHDKIKGYGEGTKLTITYAEKKGDSGLYHEWQVVSANGAQPKANGSAPRQNGNRPEHKVEYQATSLNIESHLLACADIAQKIAEKLGLLDDSASLQACFATVAIDCQRHNVILGDSSPSRTPEAESDNARKEALLKGVRSACKLLNDEGYDPPFKPSDLDEYANEIFATTTGVAGLSAEDTEDLMKRLSEKLDNFRLNKTVGDEMLGPDDDQPF